MWGGGPPWAEVLSSSRANDVPSVSALLAFNVIKSPTTHRGLPSFGRRCAMPRLELRFLTRASPPFHPAFPQRFLHQRWLYNPDLLSQNPNFGAGSPIY